MAAGLRKMQENRGVSENRIDKLRFSNWDYYAHDYPISHDFKVGRDVFGCK